MNKIKSSNPVRLIAFFLTAFLLVCTFGFTADGWQIGNSGDNNSSIITNKPGDGADQNNTESDKDTNKDEEEIPEIYIPPFTNRLTGIEANEETANAAHYAFVMNPDLPCYGISGADIICEIPTEAGARLITFIPENEPLWKIGSLVPTRGYISNIVKYLGGICVSAGKDDRISYVECEIGNTYFDLTENESFCYTEFNTNVYTNSDLLSTGISESGILSEEANCQNLPYVFSDFGSAPLIYGDRIVNRIRYSLDERTLYEFVYDNNSKRYSLIKNGSALTDAINGKTVDFTNCFILFADSVIYDNSQCSQMVMDTIGGGVGYYISQGGICKINWSSTADGVMRFSMQDGTDLIINRGNIYLTFLKSSIKEKLIFE